MKNAFIFLSVCLLSFGLLALPPHTDKRYKVFMTWKQDRKLSWDDFQGKPVANSHEAAMTASSVEFSYYTKNQQIGWLVTAKYFPKLSWVKNNKQSDYILNHEQRHFDITELYARMFRKQLSENVKSAKDLKKLEAISKQILEDWQEEQHAYDRETNHSVNFAQQKAWDSDIQERLDALSEFASDN